MVCEFLSMSCFYFFQNVVHIAFPQCGSVFLWCYGLFFQILHEKKRTQWQKAGPPWQILPSVCMLCFWTGNKLMWQWTEEVEWCPEQLSWCVSWVFCLFVAGSEGSVLLLVLVFWWREIWRHAIWIFSLALLWCFSIPLLAVLSTCSVDLFVLKLVLLFLPVPLISCMWLNQCCLQSGVRVFLFCVFLVCRKSWGWRWL